MQGRRRVSKSGTAIDRHMGESRRGVFTPSRKRGSGDLPRENFEIQDVCRSDYNGF